MWWLDPGSLGWYHHNEHLIQSQLRGYRQYYVEEIGGGVTRLLRRGIRVMLISVSEMKKIFGKIDTSRRDDKESEKAHSSFIGKKYNVGKHTVVVEVSRDQV